MVYLLLLICFVGLCKMHCEFKSEELRTKNQLLFILSSSSEDHIFTHKLHCNSKFDDIGFLLTKDNMVNVLAREIEFMCAVLENDLAQENEKLRDGQVYR